MRERDVRQVTFRLTDYHCHHLHLQPWEPDTWQIDCCCIQQHITHHPDTIVLLCYSDFNFLSFPATVTVGLQVMVTYQPSDRFIDRETCAMCSTLCTVTLNWWCTSSTILQQVQSVAVRSGDPTLSSHFTLSSTFQSHILHEQHRW